MQPPPPFQQMLDRGSSNKVQRPHFRTSNKRVLKAHCAASVTDDVVAAAVVDAVDVVAHVVVDVVADLHRLFFCPKVLNWWRRLNKSGQIEFN